MSKSTEISYSCPNCRRSSKFTLWQSINVYLDPQLKQRVLDGSLFVFKCSNCSFQQEVSNSVLYHDQQQRCMIWWIPEDEKGKQIYNSQELNLIARNLPGYKLRLVPSPNRLREKIFIFDSGLDDRAIEVLKHFMWSIYLENQGIDKSQVFFSRTYPEDGFQAVEFLLMVPGSNPRVFATRGKGGYSRALELMNKNKVPTEEQTVWRTIDITYWDLVERGEG